MTVSELLFYISQYPIKMLEVNPQKKKIANLHLIKIYYPYNIKNSYTNVKKIIQLKTGKVFEYVFLKEDTQITN